MFKSAGESARHGRRGMVAACQSPAGAEPPPKVKIFGRDRVIAFTFCDGKFIAQHVPSATMITGGPKDWKEWAPAESSSP